MLRDVREGLESATVARQVTHAAPGGSRSASSGPPPASRSHELLSAIIGKAFVLVPLGAIVAFALWSVYQQGVGSGMSASAAVWASIASLAATVAGVFIWSAMIRRKR